MTQWMHVARLWFFSNAEGRPWLFLVEDLVTRRWQNAANIGDFIGDSFESQEIDDIIENWWFSMAIALGFTTWLIWDF